MFLMRDLSADATIAGKADWARIYLLLTALERAIEDEAAAPASALEELHAEYAPVLGTVLPTAADQLLRSELRYSRRLVDALYVGKQIDARMLARGTRPCATLGCGNDAVGSYCLTCAARRASQRTPDNRPV
jgi:hypothetical protein